jgi:hypothetical protein
MTRKKSQARIQDAYASLDELRAYDRGYGICKRLGYPDPDKLWVDNPLLVLGSSKMPLAIL